MLDYGLQFNALKYIWNKLNLPNKKNNHSSHSQLIKLCSHEEKKTY